MSLKRSVSAVTNSLLKVNAALQATPSCSNVCRIEAFLNYFEAYTVIRSKELSW